MKIKPILSFLFVFTVTFLTAQNFENNISNQICKCFGNLEKEKNPEKIIEDCFKKEFAKNYEEISKKIENKSFEDYYISIEGLLLNNCKTFLEYRKKGFIKSEQKSISNCENLKIGTYFYNILQNREKSYLTFTKNLVNETRKNNIYATYKIEWIDNCTYKLTLLESNSEYDNTNLKSRPLTFRIIENTEDYFVVQTEYFDNGGLNNVMIHKLPYIIKN